MRPAPYLDAAIRLGIVPPWIRRTSLPDNQVHLECLQCNVQHVAVTGPQAVTWATQHQCWTLDMEGNTTT